jgi:signal transduction histidine kinase
MKRPGLVWTIYSAALALALGVMLFFTVKMLYFERSMARAQAQAALEETVRLALWRMDSAAAVLLNEKSKAPVFSNIYNAPAQQGNVTQRFDPAVQASISSNEMQFRQSLEPATAGDWHKIAPVLLNRISDILPGATLEETASGARSPGDTRLLAIIPARLVVPASALPDSSLPWNTPARVSLMIAWGCALVAATALARLLGSTVSLSSRRGTFASAVTHELRTPLTTFRMYAEMLASGMVRDEPTRRQYLDTLVAEADRLAHLIENVMAYSRLENRLASRRATAALSIEQLIQHALPALRRRAEQAGLSLNVNISDPAAACRTDPVAVGQILINLVDNACKYGQSGIELTSRLAGEGLEICVSDHGPGIAAERAGHLFQAFSKSKTDSVPGIGLGLFVSRQLARDLGGDMEHRSADPGAAFVLTLPV